MNEFPRVLLIIMNNFDIYSYAKKVHVKPFNLFWDDKKCEYVQVRNYFIVCLL